MDNQHRHIKGYRELTEAEIGLMNDIKEHEARTATLVRRINEHLAKPTTDGAGVGEAYRQSSIARTEFESAFMRLVRAIARPETPWVMAKHPVIATDGPVS